eukprot:617453-Pelagomonas_calceolata.AAC.7
MLNSFNPFHSVLGRRSCSSAASRGIIISADTLPKRAQGGMHRLQELVTLVAASQLQGDEGHRSRLMRVRQCATIPQLLQGCSRAWDGKAAPGSMAALSAARRSISTTSQKNSSPSHIDPQELREQIQELTAMCEEHSKLYYSGQQQLSNPMSSTLLCCALIAWTSPNGSFKRCVYDCQACHALNQAPSCKVLTAALLVAPNCSDDAFDATRERLSNAEEEWERLTGQQLPSRASKQVVSPPACMYAEDAEPCAGLLLHLFGLLKHFLTHMEAWNKKGVLRCHAVGYHTVATCSAEPATPVFILLIQAAHFSA